MYNATQDATGQMWFATQNGLYTYDNKYFTHYAAPKIEGRNLDNILYGVYYDKKTKLILCSSLSAIMYFDPVKRQFLVPDYTKKAITELADNQPLVFYRDKSGNMWYGTQKKGLGLWNEKTQTVKYLIEPIDGIYPRVIDMVEPIAGTIWVSTTFGLYEVNANLKPVLHKADKGLSLNNLAADTIRNCLWMGSSGKGLFRFDLKTKQFSNYKYPSYHEGNWVNDGIFISLQFLNPTELLLEGTLLFNTVTHTFSPIKVDFPDFLIPLHM
ncbi:MAG: hypothetical protein IPK62_16090 [Bacteroidetes bacterium]|nr:hypothetical protein [Bacteroidota bacterium]